MHQEENEKKTSLNASMLGPHVAFTFEYPSLFFSHGGSVCVPFGLMVTEYMIVDKA